MENQDDESMKREAESTACFQLWGEDKFSGESYFCNMYRHRSSANRARRRLEAEARSSDSEGMTDSFWIVPMTLAEHYAWMERQYRQQNKAADLIVKHKAILKEMMPRFKDFVKENYVTPGVYVLPFPQDDEDMYLVNLYMSICLRYRCRKTYDFYIGMTLSDRWAAARNSGLDARIKRGSLEDVLSVELTDDLFDSLQENFNKTIKKYFLGDW